IRGRLLRDDRGEGGDHHDEADDEIQDGAGERRLWERFAAARGGVLSSHRASRAAFDGGPLRGAATIGATARERDEIADEQRGSDGEDDLAQHVVVEAHIVIVGARFALTCVAWRVTTPASRPSGTGSARPARSAWRP